jgi:hypothetical protein
MTRFIYSSQNTVTDLLSGACLLIVHGRAADKKLAALEFCEQNHISMVFLVTLHTSFSHWTILFSRHWSSSN